MDHLNISAKFVVRSFTHSWRFSHVEAMSKKVGRFQRHRNILKIYCNDTHRLRNSHYNTDLQHVFSWTKLKMLPFFFASVTI